MKKPPLTLHLKYAPATQGKGRRLLTRIYLEKQDSSEVALNKQVAKVAPAPKGTTFSIPFIINKRKGEGATIRLRTKEDDLIAEGGSKGNRPTARAIKMANALMVERLLTTGKFGSATALAKKLGVSQPHLTGMLNMLNMEPAEMERILFETC